MSKNSDLLGTIKSLANNLTVGNKSAAEVAEALNAWLKDGGEALRVKIEDEVERSVTKMGFVKRGEFEALKEEIAALKKSTKNMKPVKKATVKGSNPKDKGAKKGTKKSSAPKKARTNKSAPAKKAR